MKEKNENKYKDETSVVTKNLQLLEYKFILLAKGTEPVSIHTPAKGATYYFSM